MDKIIIIPNGDWHMGKESISDKLKRKLVKSRIKQLSKIAFKKWSGDIYDIEDAGCDFCEDARGRISSYADNKCEICYAPKYLCDESIPTYSLYNTFEYLIVDDYKYARKAKNIMRIALLSMIIFGRVLKPIECFAKLRIAKFKRKYGDKDD